MNPISLPIFFASLCFLSISAAFDSSEIRMLEEECKFSLFLFPELLFGRMNWKFKSTILLHILDGKRNHLSPMFNELFAETQKRGRLDDPLIRFGKRSGDGQREIRNVG